MSPARRLAAIAILFATAAHADQPQNLTPPAVQRWLQDGNARFVAGKPHHCRTEEHTRESLASGQAPSAIVMSCSDSRVPPEKVFDQDLGELFTIRVAGNVLDPENIASMEYALKNLGSRLIVIMGHESCGAVKAALEVPKGGDAGSPSLNLLIADIRTNLGPSPATIDKTLRGPVKANVDAVANALLKRSPIVKEAVTSGRVKIVRAIYSLASGQVEFWD